MLSVPQTSTSQALGIRLLLIMLMMVQGTTPKYSSIAVQHCTALTLTSVDFIQSSTTKPSLAILISAASGIPLVVTYLRMSCSFPSTPLSVSLSLAIRPRISERSTVSTEMPWDSRIFSL